MESRNIGFEVDITIIFTFPYNLFCTARLNMHSEPLTVFTEVKSQRAQFVFGRVTSKYTTPLQKHGTNNSTLTHKNAN